MRARPSRRLGQLAGRCITDAEIFTCGEEVDRFDFLHVGLDGHRFVEVVPFLETSESGHISIRLKVTSPMVP